MHLSHWPLTSDNGREANSADSLARDRGTIVSHGVCGPPDVSTADKRGG